MMYLSITKIIRIVMLGKLKIRRVKESVAIRNEMVRTSRSIRRRDEYAQMDQAQCWGG